MNIKDLKFWQKMAAHSKSGSFRGFYLRVVTFVVSTYVSFESFLIQPSVGRLALLWSREWERGKKAVTSVHRGISTGKTSMCSYNFVEALRKLLATSGNSRRLRESWSSGRFVTKRNRERR